MTALEHILEGDWGGVQRLVDRLQTALIDTGGKTLGVRFGAGTLTFSGAVDSAANTITHGLGRTPVVVFVSLSQGSAGMGRTACETDTVGATTFRAFGFDTDAIARTGTITVYWLVIG